MTRWIDDLYDTLANDECGVIVTVAGVRGSAPREIGAKMIVTATETIGSIGGGQLEYQCTGIAVQQLGTKGAYRAARLMRRFPLGANCGQCCGGVVDVLFERVAPGSQAWLHELKCLHDEHRPVVLLTPVEQSQGRYLVTADRCHQFQTDVACDDEVIATARQILIENGGARVLDGHLLEPVLPIDFHVAIFGAGHVGTAIVDVLAKLDCRIRWIDSRRNVFPAQVPENVTTIESATPAREIAAMPPGSFYLVLTHSHPLDFDICVQVLRRGDFSYCGLIGSQSKRRRFERLMRKQAMPDALLERLSCPIGIAGIESKKPGDIAVAVAAELLQIKYAAMATIGENDAVPGNVRAL